jgi:protein SCO1
MMTNPTTRRLPVIAGVLLTALVPGVIPGAGPAAQVVSAQSYVPRESTAPADAESSQLKRVDMDYHLGAQVSPDLVFTDSDGRRVRLGDYFDGERPVILQLGYYQCPMLCGLVFQGVRTAVGEMDWVPGDQYRIITVSIDPAEPPSLAKKKKETVATDLKNNSGKTGTEAGWHFLVGESHMIEQLADEVGFGFKWVREQQQFAHPAVIMILSPDGTITRYLSGVKYDPQTLRLSLVEASDGKVGSLVDQFLLTCLHYDPSLGTYSATAMGIMRIGGAVTVAVLAVAIGLFLWREHRRRNAHNAHTAADHAAQG